MPPSAWCLTATPWIALACNIGSNLLILRAFPHVTIVRSLAGAFLIGCLVFAAAATACLPVMADGDRWVRVLAMLLTYVCSSYFFFHVVHIPEASVRIRILQELATHGTLTDRDVLDRYDAKMILSLRLERLTRSGQLVMRDGRYYTGRKRMLHVARLFRSVKRIALGAR